VKLAIVLALLAPLQSCISLTWQHEITLEPVRPEAVATLQPGTSDLGACLDALGAPLYVWEYRGDEIALAFGWLESRHWGAGVRAQVVENVSASFNYDAIDAATEGYVLFFDEAWKLTAVRRGKLRNLAAAIARHPPAPVED
jgi:hypothetical protein